MARADVELVQRLYERWERGDDSALELLDGSFEYVNPESAVEPGTRRGRDGWLAAMESVERAFERYSHEPRELIDANGRVLALVTFRARGRDSGLELSIPEQHVWTVANGRVVRLEWFHDEAAARRAAGL